MRINLSVIIAFFAFLTGCVSNDVPPGITAYNAGNFESAFNLILPVAEKGDRRAQYRIGSMYLGGKGVSKNLKQAAYWYQKSANKGYPWAQVRLGTLYYKAQGVDYDHSLAYFWTSLGAANSYLNEKWRIWAGDRRDKIFDNLTLDEVTAVKEKLRAWRPTG